MGDEGFTDYFPSMETLSGEEGGDGGDMFAPSFHSGGGPDDPEAYDPECTNIVLTHNPVTADHRDPYITVFWIERIH